MTDSLNPWGVVEDRLASREVILARDELPHRLAERLLFCTELEVHGGYRPSRRCAMMLRWISFGPTVDRGLAQIEVARGQPCRHRLEGVRSERLHLELRERLLKVRAANLEHRGLRSGIRAALKQAQHREFEREKIDLELRDALTEPRIIHESSTLERLALGKLLQASKLTLGLSKLRDAGALVCKEIFGVRPALILRSDPVCRGHAHVVEPDLIHLVPAIEQGNRSHRDSRRLHVDEQEGNAGLRPHLRIRAYEAEDPVSKVSVRVPGLLAIHQILIATQLRARSQRGKIRARSRLRVTLTPPVLARENARQKVFLLRRAAEGHEHGPHHVDAEGKDRWGAGETASSSNMSCCNVDQPGPPKRVGHDGADQPRSSRTSPRKDSPRERAAGLRGPCF